MNDSMWFVRPRWVSINNVARRLRIPAYTMLLPHDLRLFHV